LQIRPAPGERSHVRRDRPAPPPPLRHRRHDAASQFAFSGTAEAQPAKTKSAASRHAKSGINTSFASLKQVGAGLLNVGYAEAGPADGPAVILLHGWPYDIYSFADVAPLLVSAGCRVIVPYLRGYGTTRFLSDATVRNGQPSALAVDIIALVDALRNNPISANQIRLKASLMNQEHHPIRLRLLAGLSFRQ
jgi:hypothetical protein